MPSSRGSSRPRDQTRVSYSFYSTGGVFTTEPLSIHMWTKIHAPKVQHLEEYSSLTFNTLAFTITSILSQDLSLWVPFHDPKRRCCTLISSHSPFPSPQSQATTIGLLSLWICLFRTLHINGSKQYMPFCVWLLPLSLKLSRFIHPHCRLCQGFISVPGWVLSTLWISLYGETTSACPFIRRQEFVLLPPSSFYGWCCNKFLCGHIFLSLWCTSRSAIAGP